jgi:hypothetical protein
MITDLFLSRYPNPWIGGSSIPPSLRTLFAQAAHIIFEDLRPDFELEDSFFQSVNSRLSREVGVPTLIGNGTGRECAIFLYEPYDLFNNAHGNPDVFVKLRVSLIELVFREAEHHVAGVVSGPAAGLNPVRAAFNTNRGRQAFNEGYGPRVKRMIDELNIRLRDSGTGLHYHNGLIQLAHDTMTQSQIASPFWDIVKDPRWSNVDRDMKEAIDRRDTGGRDPAGYALRALESTIKVISAQKAGRQGKKRARPTSSTIYSPRRMATSSTAGRQTLCGRCLGTFATPLSTARELLPRFT